MKPSQLHEWREALARLREHWAPMALPAIDDSAEVAQWEQQLARLTQEVGGLKRAGLWTRGPADLLTICRVHRRELAHTAVLAWLCDPEATHGLGDRFLSGLLGITGEVPDLATSITSSVEVGRENSRADVVVSDGTWTLVVEAKVDADESVTQCERLYRDWMDEPSARFLFLTKSGRAPREVTSDEAQEAWASASWADVVDLLLVSSPHPSAPAPGAAALAEYTRTLARLYGRRTT